jgi:hypothetical protein
MGALAIRTMTRRDVDFALGLAADEGWNPGLGDAEAFYAADPAGFLIGEVGARPVACISAVAYGTAFGFIGLYIVVPGERGHGYGLALWQAGIARLAGRNIGLDGVLAQQANYRRSGFMFAYSNIRYERSGTLAIGAAPPIVAAGALPFAQLSAYDRALFPAEREAFLRRWLAPSDGAALACVIDGAVHGYGVIRRCRRGFKIGPLFADEAAIADALYIALAQHAGSGEPVYLDVPEVNAPAMAMAARFGMREVFGTARMYTDAPPAIDLDRVYGVTTFELG